MWWYNALYCENELYTHSNRWMVGVVVSSIVAISVFINLFLSGAFYFTTWKIIKKHRDLMKLCRSEKLTNADLERLIQLVGDKVVDVNRRMKYDYAGLDLKTLGTGGAVTALELLFISNKSNDLTNCVESILNAEPAFSLKNICNAITVLTNNTDVLNRDVILQKLMEAKRTQLSTSSNREYRVS